MGTKKKVEIAGIESKAIHKDQSVGNGRKYTSKFKEDCINYYLQHQNEKAAGKIASDLGIPSSTFFGWINKHKKKSTKTLSININSNNDILLLKSEIKKLKNDIEVLKKALVIFIKGVD